jgi:hypothetical protein
MSTPISIARLIAAFEASLAADQHALAAAQASVTASTAQINLLEARIVLRFATIAALTQLQTAEPLDIEQV